MTRSAVSRSRSDVLSGHGYGQQATHQGSGSHCDAVHLPAELRTDHVAQQGPGEADTRSASGPAAVQGHPCGPTLGVQLQSQQLPGARTRPRGRTRSPVVAPDRPSWPRCPPRPAEPSTTSAPWSSPRPARRPRPATGVGHPAAADRQRLRPGAGRPRLRQHRARHAAARGLARPSAGRGDHREPPRGRQPASAAHPHPAPQPPASRSPSTTSAPGTPPSAVWTRCPPTTSSWTGPSSLPSRPAHDASRCSEPCWTSATA